MGRHEEDNAMDINSLSVASSTAPAIVVVCLGGVLFLVGIVAVTAFLFRRKSSVPYRKSGVYLTNRSPINEDVPLRSQVIIRKTSEANTCGTRTPHLVMKKSPSPPLHYMTPSPSSKNVSPGTPTEDGIGLGGPGGGGGGRRINRNAIAIHTNPICNTATYCEVHGSTKCTHGTKPGSNHLVKKDANKSPRTSPQISPSTSTPAIHLGSQQHNQQEAHSLNLRNGNTTCIMTTEEDHPTTSVVGKGEMTTTTSSSSALETSFSSTSEAVVTSVVGKSDLGVLHFRIRFNEEKGTLVVTVVKCEDLPVKDTSLMTCDPYVKLQLLPDKQQRVKTRVLRHTRQPVFDEDFTFYGVQLDQLTEMTLHFVMLSFDRYSRDDVIGEVFYPLEALDLQGAVAVDISVDIQPRNYKMQTQGRGEVLLSLCWQPTANRLTVVVLKARNLPKMDVSGLADPYVKLYLMYDGQRLVKKKTHVKKRTLNPVFNESFVFDLPPAASQGSNLEKVSLQIQLLDWDRVTKNEVIGRLEIGSGSGMEHWNEVLNCPRRQIAEWHKLLD